MATYLYDLEVRSLGETEASTPVDGPCPVCGATEARPAFAIDGMENRVVVCSGCGTGRFDPMPSDDEIGDFYPTDYYGGGSEKFTRLIETMVRVVAARHVRFLTRGLPAGARVLDVGCGRGLVLADLADHGYEVHGVERSEAAATGADERADIRIVSKLADAGYPDGWFDEVLIWHVL